MRWPRSRRTCRSYRQQLDQNLHSLAVLTGSAPEQMKVGEVQLSAHSNPGGATPTCLRACWKHAPIYARRKRTLQSANYSVGAARAAYFPALLLTADGGLSSGSLSHFLTSPVCQPRERHCCTDLRWRRVAWPASCEPGGRHQRRGGLPADDRHRAAGREDSLTAAQQQQLAEAFDQTAADAARRAATLAEAQYKFGTVDFLTVLDAQRTLYQAEDTAGGRRGFYGCKRRRVCSVLSAVVLVSPIPHPRRLHQIRNRILATHETRRHSSATGASQPGQTFHARSCLSWRVLVLLTLPGWWLWPNEHPVSAPAAAIPVNAGTPPCSISRFASRPWVTGPGAQHGRCESSGSMVNSHASPSLKGRT